MISLSNYSPASTRKETAAPPFPLQASLARPCGETGRCPESRCILHPRVSLAGVGFRISPRKTRRWPHACSIPRKDARPRAAPLSRSPDGTVFLVLRPTPFRRTAHARTHAADVRVCRFRPRKCVFRAEPFLRRRRIGPGTRRAPRNMCIVFFRVIPSFLSMLWTDYGAQSNICASSCRNMSGLFSMACFSFSLSILRRRTCLGFVS